MRIIADLGELIRNLRDARGFTRRELDTLVADFPDTYKLVKQDEVFKTYSFPKSYVCYRKPGAIIAKQRERARQMMIAKNKVKGV